MPWTLQIETFDVGQGESSVILANNAAAGQTRTMLIDGGLAGQGTVVNGYLDALIGPGAPVDHILVTHYDVDHSGGIIALLGADNLDAICDMVASTALAEANKGGNRPQQIASGSAGACAAFFGAYAIPGGIDRSMPAGLASFSARTLVTAATTDDNAALWGMQEAEQIVPGSQLNPNLLPGNSTLKRRRASKAIGIACANAIAANNNVHNRVKLVAFNLLRTMVNQNCRFLTDGRFNRTQIIDTGINNMPNSYSNHINGQLLMSSTWIQAPGINRQRLTPALGTEVLWNSGPNAMQAPVNSPMLYIMAHNAYVWNAPANTVPLAQAIDNNNASFGLILRFNNFFYYTGGDLISAGEDLIATAVMNNGLPNPAGGPAFPRPNCIAAFKCGHHGADTCTSQNFLNTGLPRAAFISCGYGHEHPFQTVVNELHNSNTIQYFYLTTCTDTRVYIPASSNPPLNQLTTVGNKSRVAGGYAFLPGNISLLISQAEASSRSSIFPLNPGDTSLRQFRVNYYDYDTPQAFRTETTIF